MLTQSTLYLAAQELASVQLTYAQGGRSLSDAVLCGAKEFVEWQHYPNNDLVDKASGYEFYYHSHSVDEMPKGEHGHFHVIKRDGKKFHHLIGIALNQKGLPVRLFTTNGWVTGEVMATSKMVMKSVVGFNMTVKGRMAPISKWLGALVKLFKPEIERLVLKRDQEIEKLEKTLGSRELVLSLKKYHVLTECKIDLMDRLSKHLVAVNS